jgi:hypothetical protein
MSKAVLYVHKTQLLYARVASFTVDRVLEENRALTLFTLVLSPLAAAMRKESV